MKFSISSPKKAGLVFPDRSPQVPPNENQNKSHATVEKGDISPELVPIVTLLSAQMHRRYYEGTFMLYNDLNGEGNPADREWREVYGILTGNQLAYWDAANLAQFKDSAEQVFNTSSKPKYLNFTDAVFSAMISLPAAKMSLENVLLVSTTLKNRYILQFRELEHLRIWTLALRLAVFEHQSLQEAYTGALLSARGSRLSDIRIILAQKRFNHVDWVKIRYGSGMAWKRCYAVIEPSTFKKKSFFPGRVLLYESATAKKKQLVGEITSATSVTAVYPQSPIFIDQSTIMKLEGSINFKSPSQKAGKSGKSRKSGDLDAHETSLFLMPEEHSSVPGFDTLIRFLIPLYDAFGLYGRPQRLKADRMDVDSLVFGLPTLPHVHYLTIDDLRHLAVSAQFTQWDTRAWRQNIRAVLQVKMSSGYDGCGSARGFSGAVLCLNSPHFGSVPGSPRVLSQPMVPVGPAPELKPGIAVSGNLQTSSVPQQRSVSEISQLRDFPTMVTAKVAEAVSITKNIHDPGFQPGHDSRGSVQLAEIYHKYSRIETPSDRFGDRNQLLKGSSEEIDENSLPAVMRQKSLRHGPYPENDCHLIGSDDSGNESESELGDEDSRSSGSFVKGHDPRLLAAPNSYEERNLSYSSVHSPLTQYHEFNQQFSKSVVQKKSLKVEKSESALSSESNDETDFSDGSSPPSAPAHGSNPQLPQIQQLSSLHSTKQHTTPPMTPSSGEKLTMEQIFVQKSEATQTSGHDSDKLAESDHRPRYIQIPGSAPTRSPQDLPLTNGVFSHLSEQARSGAVQQEKPQPTQNLHQQTFQISAPQMQEVFEEAYARNGSYEQNTSIQQGPRPQNQQSGQQVRNRYDVNVQSNSRPGLQGVSQGASHNFQSVLQGNVQESANGSVQRIPPLPKHRQTPIQQHAQIIAGQKMGPSQQYQDLTRPNMPQDGTSNGHYKITQPLLQNFSQNMPQNYSQNVLEGAFQNTAHSRLNHSSQPVQQQYLTVSRHNQQMGQGQPMNSTRSGYPSSSQYQQMSNGYTQHPQQRQAQPQPYNSKMVLSDHPAQTPPMQHSHQQRHENYQLPPRPQGQPSKSAQNIRSYSDQYYQYQAQPNMQQGRVHPQGQGQGQGQSQGQRPNDAKEDPRLNQPTGSHEYMRQY